MNSSAPITRLLAASLFVSVAALAVGTTALLRGQPQAGRADTDLLVALRSELGELRRSVEVTRNQASGASGFADVAELERRLSQLEGHPAAPPPVTAAGPTVLSASAPTAASASPQPVAKAGPSFSSPHPAISIEAGPGGRLIVHNSDPALTGQKMVVHGINEDGRIFQSDITVPEPS